MQRIFPFLIQAYKETKEVGSDFKKEGPYEKVFAGPEGGDGRKVVGGRHDGERGGCEESLRKA